MIDLSGGATEGEGVIYTHTCIHKSNVSKIFESVNIILTKTEYEVPGQIWSMNTFLRK